MLKWIGIVICSSVSVMAIEKEEVPPPCQSAKEFISAYEFLKSKSNLIGASDQAVKVAKQVASGCVGAAHRFIKTVELLEKTELSMKDIVETSLAMAKSHDDSADAFRTIFTKSYASDVFDLDYHSSLKLARSLSVDFKGDVKNAMKDFEKISRFCLGSRGLDLPKPECAKMAERVALIGQKHKTDVADSFVDGYEYMTQEKKVGLTTGEALKLTEKLLNKSSDGVQSFKLAFEYATNKSGLGLSREDAIRLASEL